jgi:hypothetical protein
MTSTARPGRRRAAIAPEAAPGRRASGGLVGRKIGDDPPKRGRDPEAHMSQVPITSILLRPSGRTRPSSCACGALAFLVARAGARTPRGGRPCERRRCEETMCEETMCEKMRCDEMKREARCARSLCEQKGDIGRKVLAFGSKGEIDIKQMQRRCNSDEMGPFWMKTTKFGRTRLRRNSADLSRKGKIMITDRQDGILRRHALHTLSESCPRRARGGRYCATHGLRALRPRCRPRGACGGWSRWWRRCARHRRCGGLEGELARPVLQVGEALVPWRVVVGRVVARVASASDERWTRWRAAPECTYGAGICRRKAVETRTDGSRKRFQRSELWNTSKSVHQNTRILLTLRTPWTCNYRSFDAQVTSVSSRRVRTRDACHVRVRLSLRSLS